MLVVSLEVLSSNHPSAQTKIFYISARTAETGNFNLSTFMVNQGNHVVIRLTALDTTHGIIRQKTTFAWP